MTECTNLTALPTYKCTSEQNCLKEMDTSFEEIK